jgi:hypothetical protein
MCLDRASEHIYISQDVVFKESLFPFASSSTSPSSSPTNETVACNDHLRNYRVELMTTNVHVKGGCVSRLRGAPLAHVAPIEDPPSPAVTPCVTKV